MSDQTAPAFTHVMVGKTCERCNGTGQIEVGKAVPYTEVGKSLEGGPFGNIVIPMPLIGTCLQCNGTKLTPAYITLAEFLQGLAQIERQPPSVDQ